MKKKISIIILLAIVGLSSAFAQKNKNVIIAPPANDSLYENVPIKKMVNPVFYNDYANKWVHFKTGFVFTMASLEDLPKEYQKDYVRIITMETADLSFTVIVPKSKSDIVFDLKSMDPIEIFGYSNLVKYTDGTQGLIIKVEKTIIKQ